VGVPRELSGLGVGVPRELSGLGLGVPREESGLGVGVPRLESGSAPEPLRESPTTMRISWPGRALSVIGFVVGALGGESSKPKGSGPGFISVLEGGLSRNLVVRVEERKPNVGDLRLDDGFAEESNPSQHWEQGRAAHF
jgi:hypothetical protein